jgi:hypothetical protein
MKLSIASNALNNITEIWAHGENAIMVGLRNGNRYRVTAIRNIYSGSQYKFAPFYEVETAVTIQEKAYSFWAVVSLPSEGGETIEHCLENALRFLNAN